MSSHLPRTLALALLSICLLPAAAPAQSPSEAGAPQVFCEPSRAVALVGGQVTEAKALDFPPGRVGVLTRAADLLWPHDEQQARAVFTEAFRLAPRAFRERSGELGARDFEATLAHAVRLGDRHLRATAVLALTAKCLEGAGR